MYQTPYIQNTNAQCLRPPHWALTSWSLTLSGTICKTYNFKITMFSWFEAIVTIFDEIWFTYWHLTHCILAFLSSADFFFKINFLKKFFQKYHQNVKQFGPWSGPTILWAWSGSKLFAKVNSRRHSGRQRVKRLIIICGIIFRQKYAYPFLLLLLVLYMYILKF